MDRATRSRRRGRTRGRSAGPARAGPQRRDECQRRRVGHAGGHAAEDPREDKDLDRGRAVAARMQAGTDSTTPRTSMSFRPYRSPSAPSHSTDPARPSEYPTATRFNDTCEASKARPMSGSATFATDRLRFATAATRISDRRTSPALSGAVATAVPAGALAVLAGTDAEAAVMGQVAPISIWSGRRVRTRRVCNLAADEPVVRRARGSLACVCLPRRSVTRRRLGPRSLLRRPDQRKAVPQSDASGRAQPGGRPAGPCYRVGAPIPVQVGTTGTRDAHTGDLPCHRSLDRPSPAARPLPWPSA